MQQVSDTFYTTYEVKRSTFTSYLVPWSAFEQTRKQLHQQHPKASHIVWAYRHLNEYDQIVENSTDDGEPKGCAGNPTLAQLRGADLINTALLTVRYFGGIKLGTGGMVRAYRDAAREVIDNATLHPYIKKSAVVLETPYALVKRYEHFFTQQGIDFGKRDFNAEGVVWHLQLSEEEQKVLKSFQTSRK